MRTTGERPRRSESKKADDTGGRLSDGAHFRGFQTAPDRSRSVVSAKTRVGDSGGRSRQALRSQVLHRNRLRRRPGSSDRLHCGRSSSRGRRICELRLDREGEQRLSHSPRTRRRPGYGLSRHRCRNDSARSQSELLLYDSIHVPNSDPGHVIGGQPHRMSLWEVHPVTEFLVCAMEDGSPKARCDPSRAADWLPIENYPAPPPGHATEPGSR